MTLIALVEDRTKLRHRDVILARERAHAAFDQLHLQGWKTKKDAYAWLTSRLRTTVQEGHIGRLSIEQCEQVYSLATDRLRKFGENARGQHKGLVRAMKRLRELAQRALASKDDAGCRVALRSISEQLEARTKAELPGVDE